MTTISLPTPLWSPTNGDWPYPATKYWTKYRTYLVSQILLHRAMLNDERVYPEPHEFKPERFLKNGKLDRSVRDPMNIAFGFGRRWAFCFPLHKSTSHKLSSSIVITFLVEFAPENISLIQFSCLLLHLFCQHLTWWEKWMRLVGKLSPRGNILIFWYGKLHF